MRSGLSKALLDKTIDDLGDSQGAGTKGPAVLRADILEYTGEEDFEHIVHFLFGEQALRVRLCLQRDTALK